MVDRVTGIQKIGRSCTESKFQNPTWNHRAYVIVNKGFDVILASFISALDSFPRSTLCEKFRNASFPPAAYLHYGFVDIRRRRASAPG